MQITKSTEDDNLLVRVDALVRLPEDGIKDRERTIASTLEVGEALEVRAEGLLDLHAKLNDTTIQLPAKLAPGQYRLVLKGRLPSRE